MSKLDKITITKMIKNKDSLPMYDLINNTIIMIPNNKIYYNFTKNYLRLLDNNIMKKLKLNFTINETEMSSRFYKTIYNNHPSLGKQITFCEKPYFVYFINYNNNPYYTQKELETKNLFFDLNINDNKAICKKISKIELTKKDIINSFKYITSNSYDRILKYYSFIGAEKINNYLRGNSSNLDKTHKDIILKLDEIILKSPKLNTDQIVFRFLSDDTFLKTKIENKIFIEDAFMSTTRNPIMQSAQDNFGKYIMKIYIPKKHNDKYISIESISLFPSEQEILISRGCKLKLIKQHKINQFIIYDFELIGIQKKIQIEVESNIKELNIIYDKIEDPIQNIYDDWSYYTQINFKGEHNNLFYVGYNKQPKALKKFFHFKKNILYLYQLDKDGNIDIFIEIIENQIFINYFMKFFGHSTKENINEYLKKWKIISNIGILFNISKIKINTIQIPGYLLHEKNLSNNQICLDYYDMLKKNNFDIPSFLKLDFPTYYIKYLKKAEIKNEYISEFPSLKLFSLNNNIKFLDKLFIQIIEKEPSLMIEFNNLCSYYYDSYNNPFNNDNYSLDLKKMFFN
jgi:hypothetical protein